MAEAAEIPAIVTDHELRLRSIAAPLLAHSLPLDSKIVRPGIANRRAKPLRLAFSVSLPSSDAAQIRILALAFVAK
jgi:hypothetical protein